MREQLPDVIRLNGGLARWVHFVGLLAVVAALYWGLRQVPALAPLVDYPESWRLPLSDALNAVISWLIDDLNFWLFTFQEFMRSIAAVMRVPHSVLLALLSKGIELPWLGGAIPPLSWLAVTGVMVYAAHAVGGRGLAVLLAAALLYLAIFGQWAGAMITLSSVLVAVPFGVAGGLMLGIWSYRSPVFERALTPVLDMMQTVPIFAYLVPVLALFGFGPVAALVATVIYAMPPMVRVTILALKSVPADICEFGRMAGCTRRQLTWKIMVPAARYRLMVGVNQVIMLTLNMVIIASMIGAGGLGYDVLNALRQLNIGASVEAGLGISLIAIAMDRFTRAMTELQPTSAETTSTTFVARNKYVITAIAVLVGTTLAGLLMPGLAPYPEWAQMTTASYWDAAVSWINVTFGDALYAMKSFLLINVMIPVKRFLLEVPWALIVTLIAAAGYRLGGWRLAATVAGFGLFIVLTGNWDKAVVSIYLTGFAVLIAGVLGVTVGVMAALNDRVHRVAQITVDVLQTLPAFVYLIPAVMLFQVGEFSALLAIVAYAIAPAIRYTDHGLRGISANVIEAATISGCTRWQKLLKVQIPLAFPDILLGLNQTIMMALSMLVITALIGTSDLGQETYIALTQADPGLGLVAGLCVACIAMTADRLIQAAALRRKQDLGLT